MTQPAQWCDVFSPTGRVSVRNTPYDINAIGLWVQVRCTRLCMYRCWWVANSFVYMCRRLCVWDDSMVMGIC